MIDDVNEKLETSPSDQSCDASYNICKYNVLNSSLYQKILKIR